MFLDISTLKDETNVHRSRLRLFQLASQILLPIRATSISLYLNWRRGYLETTTFFMFFILPRLDLWNPLRQILLRLSLGLACRILPWGFGEEFCRDYLYTVLLHTPPRVNFLLRWWKYFSEIS
jgi:hypothetical protein